MTVASVFAMTDRGAVRPNNEDAVMIARARTGEIITLEREAVVDLSEGPLIIAVSDGMGGANAGEVASIVAIEAMCAHLAEELATSAAVDALRSAVARANEGVRAASIARPDHFGMGATLVAALVDRERAHVALVGDSRAYVLRRGRLAPLTRDQTLVQELVDRGVLTPEQARSSPHKAVVLQAIGLNDTVEPAILELALRRGDRLLLCSDGLTSEIAEDEIAILLGADEDPRETCRALVAAANGKGGGDNISVAVAFVGGDDLQPPSRNDIPPAPPPSGRFVTSGT